MATRTIIKVVAGSTNRVKTDACKEALIKCFPDADISVDGVAAASGVPDQPNGDAETQRGAVNRALAAAKAWSESHDGQQPDFAIGLEGGIVTQAHELPEPHPKEHMECFAWMAVFQPSTGKWGVARTGSMMLPPAVAKLIEGGMELGHADDLVFGRADSKRGEGSVGILTRGVIDRTEYYVHALVLAMVPFVHADESLYPAPGHK